MHRLLRELDRLDAGAPGVRSAARRPGDLRRKTTAGSTAVVLAVAIGGLVAHKQWGVYLDAEGIHRAKPLGTAPEVAHGGGSFGFMQTQPGSSEPVAYDPCRPIEYVVNPAAAPVGAEGLLESAIDEISASTGLAFRSTGTTERLPQEGARPGATRRDPVLIAWTSPEVVPALAGTVAGIGGSQSLPDDFSGELYYVTGMVALDAPQAEGILSRPNGRGQLRAIMLHELGHLVGLAHVDDQQELMYSENVGRLDLGPGDREGLATLGSGRCFH
jgi:hypothetical protein